MQIRRLLFSGLFLLIGAVIAFTLSQQQQDNRSKAPAGSTTLSFAPTPPQTAPLRETVGQPVKTDVMIHPGSHLPSTVKLELLYDSTKFQAATNPFTVNTQAFPVVLEGPVSTAGKIVVTVGIAANETGSQQAITTEVKVGTLNLTARSETAVSRLTFGAGSEVYSISPSDTVDQNVLVTTEPGHVAIAPTISATPTPRPPTNTSVPTATPIPPRAAPTRVPTPLPTTFEFAVFLHGIGNGGDSANPRGKGNFTPKHPERTVTVELLNGFNTVVLTQQVPVTFDRATGSFKGRYVVNRFAGGLHTANLKGDQYLRMLIPGIQTVAPGEVNILPSVTLVTGDIDNDNSVSILDYNILQDCYSDLLPAKNCTASTTVSSDLNDDGKVNQLDYNLFIRELTNRGGKSVAVQAAVPADIPADCSADVTDRLNTWLGTVPDGAEITFTPNGCYQLDRTFNIANRHHLTIEGNGATLERKSPTPHRPNC